MKILYHLSQWLILIVTVIAWLLLICGADSIAEQGLLIESLIVLFMLTGICYCLVDMDDLARMFKIRNKNEEV